MKLNKLVLQGYKTFATKTEFIFDDGITAVVGPNGSGKSNVADAIRWVLGEQSYSTLRGKKTVDMIFAGSKNRARAGMAQATLTLDNSDGWLPIDFTEVEITRRAYRSGENEYLLNGQKVRLMDINELLAKAGIAEQTYTIIGQGLIDQALSLKADERRALFEEAAGISHYKSRRAASLRRLQDTQRNLERVYDILSELKPRLNSLRRQAERAENFGRVEEDLRQMLRVWYGFHWEKARTTLRRRRIAATEADTAWQASRSTMLALQEKIEQTRSNLHAIEEEVQRHQEEREIVRDRWEKARRQVAILQERQQALERQLHESENDLPELQAQKETAAAELSVSLSEMKTAQAELDSQQIELKAFETGFADQQQLINALRRTTRDLEEEQRQLRAEIARSQGQISQLQERLNHDSEGAAADEKESQATLETALDEQQKNVDKAKSKLIELIKKRDEALQVTQNREAAVEDKRQAIEAARTALNDAQNTVTRLQTRSEMIGQRRPSPKNDLENGADFSRLVERITIPAGVRDHLAHALGALADTLIVTQAAEIKRLLNSRSPDGALAAIARDQANPSANDAIKALKSRDGVLGRASDFCDCASADRPVIDALLGHLILVQNDDTARVLATELPAGAVAVSPTGLMTHPTGLVVAARQDGRDTALAREQAWREIQEALSTAQTDQEIRKGELDAAQQKYNESQAALESITRNRRSLTQQIEEARQHVRELERESDRLAQRRDFIVRQQQRQAAEQSELTERITRLEEKNVSKNERLDQIDQELEQKQKELSDMPVGEARQQRQVLTQQISGARSIVAGRQAIVDSRQTALRQLEQQIGRLQRRRQEWDTQLKQITTSTDQAELNELESRLEGLRAALQPLQERLRSLQRELRSLESEAAAAQKSNHERETRYTQTKVAFTQQETHVENLQDRIRAELGIVDLSYDDDVRGDTPLPMRDVVEKLPQVDELPEELEGAIQKQRSQLSRMGAINPDAPAEFKEVQERFDFMNEQIEDLTQTEAQLREVIEELDELTSRAFAETVEKVNIVFGEMFTRLFGGGSGQLMLTDPDDLTVSGVDIIAQLPGRRPQGLALLSGGERSLTAASLIFALLKVSPTPFCAMDEVDAALDEANVNRFRDVLTELSQKTQFIVITHNRGTVQAAQAIYGITMGTDSTSQVISIRPEEYITQKELV